MIKVTSWAWSPILPIKPANSEQLQQFSQASYQYLAEHDYGFCSYTTYINSIFGFDLHKITHKLRTYIIVYMYVLQYYSEVCYNHAYTNS